MVSRILILSSLLLVAIETRGAEDPPPAARSVHLFYAAPDATAFYNEVTVEESVPGSYFVACGFNHGYFGIQERASADDKIVLFSVWDAGQQDDPNAVAAERRVEVLHQGEGVEVRRFGGEGTGAQSLFPYPWKRGEAQRFAVKASVEGDRTTYAAYFFLNDKRQWKHLATFRALTKGDRLKGFYSFVEDFRRDGKSANQRRVALFGNGWVRSAAGEWAALTAATFTADDNPRTNIDAGVKGSRFYLATGGETKSSTALRSTILLTPAGLSGVPE